MTPRRKNKANTRSFLILVASIVIIGGYLWSQGELISPLKNTNLIMSLSAQDDGFRAVGDAPAQPAAQAESAEPVSAEETNTTAETVQEDTEEEPVIEQMTMEDLLAELVAQGVDIEAVTAEFEAEGRSLENLLPVVNSGRVSVEELAIRLRGETPDYGQPPVEEDHSILSDIHWEELGSVIYDFWIILVVTLLVIVFGRPFGWLMKQLKQTPKPAS